MLRTKDEIFEFIVHYFSKKGIEISMETALIEEGILDSMEIVDFIMAIEDFTDVEFDPESFEIYKFKSIRRLLDNLKELS